MNRLERVYKIDQLLQEKRVVSRQRFLDALEVSAATFKRDIEYMRDRLQAPVVWDRELNGYRYEATASNQKFELPGIWFNEQEAYALLTMHHLLSSLDQGGLIGSQSAPLMKRLESIVSSTGHTREEICHRVRLLSLAKRPLNLEHFSELGLAVMRRQRLHIAYFSRGTNTLTEREISPQRLVHYRENWYVDAWCHLRQDLRSFAVDGIRSIAHLSAAARDVDNRDLEDHLTSGYGIFAGREVRWASLRFNPERARWVSAEVWHPEQRGRFDPDGHFMLQVPFSDDRELIMDILRHGEHVEVLEPAELRAKIRTEHQAAASRHA